MDKSFLDNSVPIIVSNSYTKKFYIDEKLSSLPKEVKEAVKILFVSLTEEVGGIAIANFDMKEYDIIFTIDSDDNDYSFDEINANYKLSKIARENKELFDGIATFCKFKYNGIV